MLFQTYCPLFHWCLRFFGPRWSAHMTHGRQAGDTAIFILYWYSCAVRVQICISSQWSITDIRLDLCVFMWGGKCSCHNVSKKNTGVFVPLIVNVLFFFLTVHRKTGNFPQVSFHYILMTQVSPVVVKEINFYKDHFCKFEIIMLFISPKLNLTVKLQEQPSWPASQKPGHKTKSSLAPL